MKQVVITFFCVDSTNLLAAQTGYTINGRMNDLLDNSKVYLFHLSRREKIDSAIVRNETFVLKGNLSEVAHTYL